MCVIHTAVNEDKPNTYQLSLLFLHLEKYCWEQLLGLKENWQQQGGHSKH